MLNSIEKLKTLCKEFLNVFPNKRIFVNEQFFLSIQ